MGENQEAVEAAPEQEPVLLWMDLETTGLDPETGRILEVAWALDHRPWSPVFKKLDVESVVLSGYRRYASGPDHGFNVWQQEAWDLHVKSGLIDDLRATENHTGNPIGVPNVEADILHSLRRVVTEDTPVMLAGSNCDFERSWVRSWMPLLNDRLSHRALDVSRLRTAVRMLSREVAEEIKEAVERKRHRASDDLSDHIAEWGRYYHLLGRAVGS